MGPLIQRRTPAKETTDLSLISGLWEEPKNRVARVTKESDALLLNTGLLTARYIHSFCHSLPYSHDYSSILVNRLHLRTAFACRSGSRPPLNTNEQRRHAGRANISVACTQGKRVQGGMARTIRCEVFEVVVPTPDPLDVAPCHLPSLAVESPASLAPPCF